MKLRLRHAILVLAALVATLYAVCLRNGLVATSNETLSCLIRGVTSAGSFCYASSAPHVGGNQLWCKPLAQALALVFSGRTVVDLGGGLGHYVRYLRFHAKERVGRVRCYDGAPNVRLATHGLCQRLDLAVPQPGVLGPPVPGGGAAGSGGSGGSGGGSGGGGGGGLGGGAGPEQSDWALSLEVGEHVPARYADAFLDNLARAATVGLVLSWAVPGQRGFFHVNCLANGEVVRRVEQRGFVHDVPLTAFLRGEAVGWRSCAWFQNSLLAFRKRNATAPPDRWAKFWSH